MSGEQLQQASPEMFLANTNAEDKTALYDQTMAMLRNGDKDGAKNHINATMGNALQPAEQPEVDEDTAALHARIDAMAADHQESKQSDEKAQDANNRWEGVKANRDKGDTSRNSRRMKIVAGVASVALLASGAFSNIFKGGAAESASASSDGTGTEQRASTASASSEASKIDNEKIRSTFNKQIGEKTKGLDITVGAENIDWSTVNEQRGEKSFGFENFRSTEEIKKFLNGDSEGGKAAKAHLEQKAFAGNSFGYERALQGEGYQAVQINQGAVLQGTTYLVDGQVRYADDREVEAGDVMWVYTAKHTGDINGGASLRDACNQPGFKKYQPRQTTTKIPSITVTPNIEEHKKVIINNQQTIVQQQQVTVNNEQEVNVDIDVNNEGDTTVINNPPEVTPPVVEPPEVTPPVVTPPVVTPPVVTPPSDKDPELQPESEGGQGAGGDAEQGDDPENDSNETGYGPGDTVPAADVDPNPPAAEPAPAAPEPGVEPAPTPVEVVPAPAPDPDNPPAGQQETDTPEVPAGTPTNPQGPEVPNL